MYCYFTILINDLEKVKRLANLTNRSDYSDCTFDLQQGRYQVDAKSIMGILSLDLTKPVKMVACVPDEATKVDLTHHMNQFCVE